MMKLTTCLLLLTCFGCGGESGPGIELAPVSGVVLLDGKPVDRPVVTFYPEVGPLGVGVGNENGEFIATTNGQSGAPVGKNKVTVVSGGDFDPAQIPEADGNESAIAKKATLNTKYASKDTTDLIVEVPAEGLDNVKLELKSQ